MYVYFQLQVEVVVKCWYHYGFSAAADHEELVLPVCSGYRGQISMLDNSNYIACFRASCFYLPSVAESGIHMLLLKF